MFKELINRHFIEYKITLQQFTIKASTRIQEHQAFHLFASSFEVKIRVLIHIYIDCRID